MKKRWGLSLSLIALWFSLLFGERVHLVKGKVIDGTGMPLAGARVFVKSSPSGRTVSATDEEGHFRFSLADGTHEIVAELPSMSVAKKTIRLPEEAGKELLFRLSLAPLSEGVTVTASRNPGYTELSSVAASSLSSEELAKMQARTLTDALIALPGIQLTDVGPLRPRPVIRGFDTTRILVLVDGQRFNTFRMSTDAMGAELGLIDPQNVERIEVVRGPGSVLYGSDAIGGIIQVITKKPFSDHGQDFRLGGRLFTGYETGSHGKRLNAEVNGGNSRLAFRLGGGWDHFDDYRSAEGVVANSHAESFGGDAKLVWKAAENHSFTWGYMYKKAKDIGFATRENAPGFEANFPYNRRASMNLSYEGAFTAKAFQRVMVNLYGQDWNREFNLNLSPPALPFSQQNWTRYNMSSRGLDVQISADPVGKHLFTYGCNLTVDRSRDERQQKLFAGTARERIDHTTSVPEGEFGTFGLFVQDEFLLSKAECQTAVRWDSYRIRPENGANYRGPALQQTKASSFSGNAGVQVPVTEKLRVFGRIARAYRMPGLSERYYFGAPIPYAYFVPNPDLKPEISLGLDAGIRFKEKAFSGSVAYFHNRLSDLITWESTLFDGMKTIGIIPVYHWANVEKARIQGVEIEGSADFKLGNNRLSPYLSGSWQEGRNLRMETSLPHILPFTLSYGCAFGGKGIWLEAGGRSVFGGGYAIASQQPGAAYEEVLIAGFSVFHLRATLDLAKVVGSRLGGKNVKLHAALENLTNRLYVEPFDTVPQPGRLVKLSLEFSF